MNKNNNGIKIDKFFEIFEPIMRDVISRLNKEADKFNYDKNILICAFAKMFEVIAEITDFGSYKENDYDSKRSDENKGKRHGRRC